MILHIYVAKYSISHKHLEQKSLNCLFTQKFRLFLKCIFLTYEVIIQRVQSFPLKMIYWAVVSVFKNSSIKAQYYF